ncbi:MAG: hypothetical protein M5U26_01220 [Planctomycetota bacterium]|nr:hypothetical protein [Planctomycetota bacterium]
MGLLFALAFIATAGFGAYGAVKGYRMWMHGESDAWAFQPLGILMTAGGGAGSLIVLLLAGHASLGGGPAAAVMPLLVAALLLPYGLYFSALSVMAGERFFLRLGSIGEVRTFDKGDAAMARREYAAASACYRQDAERWPEETEAWLRLARALEADGQAEQAARELEPVRRRLLEGRFSNAELLEKPALWHASSAERERCERVLSLTLALGDLYLDALKCPERARALYDETLELMYGYPPVDAVRQRLKALSGRPAEQPINSAEAVPDVIAWEP